MSDIEGKMTEWRKTVWGTRTCPDSSQKNFTLTDEERKAIGVAIQCVEAAMAQRHPEEQHARELLHKTSCALGRLFDRMTLIIASVIMYF